MPSLRRAAPILVVALSAIVGCRKKATAADCEALVRHFAEVSAREGGLDGGAAEVAAVVRSAKTDPDALACADELEERQVRCALAAATSEAILECLER